MKHRVILHAEEHRARVIEIIKALPLEPVQEVLVREYKRNRSAEANALYWQWLTIIGGELGQSKEDVHEHMKDKFLVTIYERDDPDYAAMVQILRDVWKQGMKAEAVALRKKIVALTSTTTANVHQMSEYMTCVEHAASELAIRLPHPEDEAMP